MKRQPEKHCSDNAWRFRLQTVSIHLGTPSKVHMSQSIIHKNISGFDVKARWKQAKWPSEQTSRTRTPNIAAHQSYLSTIHHLHC